MTTKTRLTYLLKEVAEELGISLTRESALKNGHSGYRLVFVKVEGGGHTGAFGGNGMEPRKKAGEMATQLEGILSGARFVKELPLYSAAPDMFSSLVDILDYYKGMLGSMHNVDGTSKQEEKDIELAEKAIKKANPKFSF